MLNINIGGLGGLKTYFFSVQTANFSCANACLLLAFMLKFKSCLWLHYARNYRIKSASLGSKKRHLVYQLKLKMAKTDLLVFSTSLPCYILFDHCGQYHLLACRGDPEPVFLLQPRSRSSHQGYG